MDMLNTLKNRNVQKLRARVTFNADGRIQWPSQPVNPVDEAIEAAMDLPTVVRQYKVGDTCNRCNGTGRYFIHTKKMYGKCFRCTGGRLTARDISFLVDRETKGKAVCDIRGF